jgi:hypothetical protein
MRLILFINGIWAIKTPRLSAKEAENRRASWTAIYGPNPDIREVPWH